MDVNFFNWFENSKYLWEIRTLCRVWAVKSLIASTSAYEPAIFYHHIPYFMSMFMSTPARFDLWRRWDESWECLARGSLSHCERSWDRSSSWMPRLHSDSSLDWAWADVDRRRLGSSQLWQNLLLLLRPNAACCSCSRGIDCRSRIDCFCGRQASTNHRLIAFSTNHCYGNLVPTVTSPW